MLKRILRAFLIFCLIIYLIQDLLIFPGLLAPGFSGDLPEGVESQFITTNDETRIEVWRHDALEPKRGAALFIHGNGGPLPMFLSFQRWLSSLGYVSYSFDYRGYGRSSGWPSETGILDDTRTAANYAATREGIPARDLLIVGYSIGTGPGSTIAAELQSSKVLLLAPYLSLKKRAREELLIGFLTPLLRYNFDVKNAIQKLPTSSCLILAHGESDNIIDYHHSEALLRSRAESTRYLLFNGVGHNDLLYSAHETIGRSVLECGNVVPSP